MSSISQTIEVEVPLQTAYNQWTQFEEYPRFMTDVREVRQLDDAHLHWVTRVGPSHSEWTAEITEQVPDRYIEWRSLGPAENRASVTFEPVGDQHTRIHLELRHDDQGIVEHADALFHSDERRVRHNLERFKELIEEQHAATGAWRGEIHHGVVTRPATEIRAEGD